MNHWGRREWLCASLGWALAAIVAWVLYPWGAYEVLAVSATGFGISWLAMWLTRPKRLTIKEEAAAFTAKYGELPPKFVESDPPFDP